LDVHAAVSAVLNPPSFADIIVRDNLTDIGLVPSAGWHAHSPDIWVRNTNEPIPNLPHNQNPPHQNPIPGQDNYVYCRVKNIGNAPSNDVYIRAMVTHFPGLEFQYPKDFIPRNSSSPATQPLTPGTYLIGEVKISNLAPGADRIVKIPWVAALIPPKTVVINGVNVKWHPCLLLEASPHDGPMPSGATLDIQRDNNIAQRNIAILDSNSPSSIHAIVLGASQIGIRRLVIDRSRLPFIARVFIRLTDPALMQSLVTFALARPQRFQISQSMQAVEVLSTQERAELPLILQRNQFTMLFVSAPLNSSITQGELRITQLRRDGRYSAGYSLMIGGV
jgi:hypothetical protein